VRSFRIWVSHRSGIVVLLGPEQGAQAVPAAVEVDADRRGAGPHASRDLGHGEVGLVPQDDGAALVRREPAERLDQLAEAYGDQLTRCRVRGRPALAVVLASGRGPIMRSGSGYLGVLTLAATPRPWPPRRRRAEPP
jgi:hypothetical protein